MKSLLGASVVRAYKRETVMFVFGLGLGCEYRSLSYIKNDKVKLAGIGKVPKVEYKQLRCRREGYRRIRMGGVDYEVPEKETYDKMEERELYRSEPSYAQKVLKHLGVL